MNALMGFGHIAHKSMSASFALALVVFSLLQKPYLKAHSRKQLTGHFDSTDKKSHAGCWTCVSLSIRNTSIGTFSSYR